MQQTHRYHQAFQSAQTVKQHGEETCPESHNILQNLEKTPLQTPFLRMFES